MSAAIESRPPVSYQDYSLDRKAEVLALLEANAGNVLQTAKETGIHHATIQYWVANSDRFAKIQQGKQIDLAEKLHNIAHQCADLLPSMLPSASVREIVGAMGQSIEKRQLIMGLPTSISAQVERDQLIDILQSALNAGLEGEAIDVTPEPDPRCITDGTV
jgi:hypothetical protein